MKKFSVLLFTSLFSFLMLSFAHAEEIAPLSELHQKVMGSWKLDSINEALLLKSMELNQEATI